MGGDMGWVFKYLGLEIKWVFRVGGVDLVLLNMGEIW